MKRMLFFCICFVVVFASCDEREIPLFEDKNELYFNVPFVKSPRHDADTLLISFFYYKESVNDLRVPLYVNLSGNLLSTVSSYQLMPVADETSLPSADFILDEEYRYPVNQVMDTISFQVFKTEAMSSKVYTLVLTFKVNDFFNVGQQEYRKRVIRVTSLAACPKWWDKNFSVSMLGTYSEEKLKYFVNTIADDVEDILNFDKLDPALQRVCCLKFKYWLDEKKDAGEMVCEKDGTEMKVKVIG